MKTQLLSDSKCYFSPKCYIYVKNKQATEFISHGFTLFYLRFYFTFGRYLFKGDRHVTGNTKGTN